MNTGILSQTLRFRFEILFVVENHIICAGFASEFGLVSASRRSNDARAEFLSHLDQQEPHTARRRMDEHRVAALDWIGAVAEVMSSHSLQHRRSCMIEVNLIRN